MGHLEGLIGAAVALPTLLLSVSPVTLRRAELIAALEMTSVVESLAGRCEHSGKQVAAGGLLPL